MKRVIEKERGVVFTWNSVNGEVRLELEKGKNCGWGIIRRVGPRDLTPPPYPRPPGFGNFLGLVTI